MLTVDTVTTSNKIGYWSIAQVSLGCMMVIPYVTPHHGWVEYTEYHNVKTQALPAWFYFER